MTPERSPDFSRRVLEDVYKYRRKHPAVVWALWLVTGLFGGHRLYLGKTVTGLLMLATGGLGGVWWVFDAFRIRKMVDEFNAAQADREEKNLPPIEMDFMPAMPTDEELSGRPAWAELRSGRARLIGDGIVLLIAGAALGTVTASRGDPEALFAVLALIAITVLGARWDPTLPLLGELDRWSHRLRLYYRFNDPGGPLSLMFRPLVGPLTAWVRKKARAEVRLYLQLGAVFTIGFTILDIIQAAGGSGLGNIDGGALAGDLFFTFFSVYAFATPIGAVLTTHLLLERRDEVVWALSGWTIVAIGMGFL